MTILLRFIFGFILGGGLALWLLMSFPEILVLAIGVGTLSSIWGDKFILGFMSLLRYVRDFR
ncbi:MAG TPA: hypothetical protein VFD75_13370 [Pyrinomonadaceae bacterium]|nr:hypothetical protein [Pyrinomonadaceae bacterium]